MKRNVIIRSEAEQDIKEAFHWYERQRHGLRSDFLLYIEEGLEKIQSHPKMYPVVYKNIRRILIRRFPYGIFYTIRRDFISILAVFHGQRDPQRWQSRS